MVAGQLLQRRWGTDYCLLLFHVIASTVCIHCDSVALPLLVTATAGAWIPARPCDLLSCHC